MKVARRGKIDVFGALGVATWENLAVDAFGPLLFFLKRLKIRKRKNDERRDGAKVAAFFDVKTRKAAPLEKSTRFFANVETANVSRRRKGARPTDGSADSLPGTQYR